MNMTSGRDPGKKVAFWSQVFMWHISIPNQWYACNLINIEIDNNAVENLIRPLALGRKNYLFMGSPDGAKAAANIYSLLATCKANGISLYQYFKMMLEKIRYCKSPEDYRALLPQNIQLDWLGLHYRCVRRTLTVYTLSLGLGHRLP